MMLQSCGIRHVSMLLVALSPALAAAPQQILELRYPPLEVLRLRAGQSTGHDRFDPSPAAVVRKIRSPQTIGDEWPRPGTVTFQITFSVSDHLSG